VSGFAVICSGQAAQSADMFDFSQRYPAGRQVLDTFAHVFGFDLPAMVREPSGLTKNAVAQPMAVATALANWKVLAPLLPAPLLYAGYSVGEISAWSCAGAWTVAETAAACRERCRLMDACAPADGGMMAVRGINLDKLAALAAEASLFIAIVNEDDHAVLAGQRAALEQMGQRLVTIGVWTKVLEVEIPSHTPLLAQATAEFAPWLSSHLVVGPAAPVLLGVSAEACSDPVRGGQALARAISTPIQWQDCMQFLHDAGITVVLELGPGRALSALFARAHPDIQVRAVSDFRTAEGIAQWVGRYAER